MYTIKSEMRWCVSVCLCVHLGFMKNPQKFEWDIILQLCSINPACFLTIKCMMVLFTKDMRGLKVIENSLLDMKQLGQIFYLID